MHRRIGRLVIVLCVCVGGRLLRMLAQKKKRTKSGHPFFLAKVGRDFKGDFEFFFFCLLKKKRANKSQNGQHSEKPRWGVGGGVHF